VADPLAQAKHDLAIANRIVSVEGIIDAFGRTRRWCLRPRRCGSQSPDRA